MSCKSPVSTQENDVVLVLQTVLTLPELAPFLHLDDGHDSTLRVLQNPKIGKETTFKLKGKEVEFSQVYSDNDRFIEVTKLVFTDNKALLTLEIKYEGVEMNAELDKDGEVWRVKSKSLVER